MQVEGKSWGGYPEGHGPGTVQRTHGAFQGLSELDLMDAEKEMNTMDLGDGMGTMELCGPLLRVSQTCRLYSTSHS